MHIVWKRRIRINNEWSNVLGYTINELDGTNFMELVHAEDKNATANVLAKLEKGEIVLIPTAI